MLDDLVVLVGIEEVGRDPLGLAIVDVLVDLEEHVPTVFPSAHDLDIAFGVSFYERFEEFNEPLYPIGDTGRVLRVTIARVLLHRFPGISITNALEVEGLSVVQLCAQFWLLACVVLKPWTIANR